jgi:hypothetical protein
VWVYNFSKIAYIFNLEVFAPSKYNIVHCSFIGHYFTMFQPNWPSSGVQVVVVKDSAAHCNAGFFPPIVVVSGYFDYVDCTWLLLVLLGLLVVATLSVLARVEHSR